ncbi:PDZ domain-containing protein [Akkermansiaceae bacterium]|nr:PDZ domain-containing protein [Akkermansiaceae bacterium]
MLSCTGTAFSQQSLETAYRTTGEAVTAAFAPQQEVLQKSSAVIYAGRKEIAYGTVVSENGHILTKASEVEGVSGLSVRVDRESFKSAKVVMTDANWDVALLKVEASGLVPVEYAPDSELALGTWVVVNGVTSRTKRRALAGVISANAREIPAAGGPALGVTLAKADDRLEVEAVSEGSGAEEAGLKKGDVISKVNGKPTKTLKDLVKLLEDMKAGDAVKLSVKRDGKTMELDVKLSAKAELFADKSRNDQMSGDYSKRRSGFPRVIQHDILASAGTMGGPVLDLRGRLVGMNIARANRCETFAIPVEELRALAEGMMAQAAE